MYDNTDQTFVWVANGDFTVPSTIFDPTRAPIDQQPVNNGRNLAYFAFLGAGSNTVGQDGIITGAVIRLARSTVPVFVNPPLGGNPVPFLPAAVFEPGQAVGADSIYDNVANLGYFNTNLDRQSLVGEHPIIGFRVTLDDGLLHYGYIEFERRIGPLASVVPGDTILMFQPVRWAYESEPNTPITVPSAPGAALLGAGAAAGSRRRRDA